MSARKRLTAISERYTEEIHVLFGLLSAVVIGKLFPMANFPKIVLISVAASLLPDIDHFFAIFIYDKHSRYSQFLAKLLKKRKISYFAKITKENHKLSTGIYSHNFLTLALTSLLTYRFIAVYADPYWSAFLFSWSMHYVWDILEDFIYFSKPNPNWFLKFNKIREGIEGKMAHLEEQFEIFERQLEEKIEKHKLKKD